MKRILVVIVVIAVLVAAVWAYRASSPAVPVDAATAEIGTIRQYIDERGKTRLPETYRITMPYAGRIKAITLEAGDRVTAGETVAQIVPADLDIAVTETRAAFDRITASIAENDDSSVENTVLSQANEYVESMGATVLAAQERVRAGVARLDFADKNLGRVQKLRETDAVSEQELNEAEVAQIEASVDLRQDQLVLAALESIASATAMLPTMVQQYIDRKSLTRAVLERERAQFEAALEQALLEQTRGTMTSPIDGVVLRREDTSERYLAAGTELLTLGRLEDLEVEADVLTQDATSIEPGDRVEIYGPAIGDTPAAGRVSRVFPAGFTKISSLGVEQQRVTVIVRFDDGVLDRLLRARNLGVGYRVHVRIVSDERTGALVVPRSALVRDDAGRWQVFAVDQGRVDVRPIEVGLINDRLAEVTGGLEEGSVVLVAPEPTLTSGERVEPVLQSPGNLVE
ncbi:MAG: efflux RND transporter periplasmic adaptor subunit [Pirellulales bacterium]|nr:efflux RND transporter periplasmic adaptor subunit [Planctomycetales bacterium]